jgi:hypothetical protein
MAPDNHSPNRARRAFLQAGATASLLLAACGGNTVPGNVGNAPVPPGNTDTPPADTGPKAQHGEAPTAGLVYGTLLCGGSQLNAETGEKRYIFTQLNLDQAVRDKGARQKLITDIGFLAHGVIANPFAANRVLVFEKKGPGGAEIDLKRNEIIGRIRPSPGCEFYGHGAYSTDGTLVYATEYDKETYVGRMSVRRADDFSVIGDFPTHGEWPHDCQFIDGGKVVAVTNGGGSIDGGAEPNVAYVEVATGKLLEKVAWPDNPLINAGHLLVTPGGDLVVAHAMREGLDTRSALGALSIRPTGGELATMASPAPVVSAMLGETLSLAYHEKSGLLAATNPYGRDSRTQDSSAKGLLTFWDVKARKFREVIGGEDIPQPRGVAVTMDGSYFVVTGGSDRPGVILLRTDTLKPEAGMPPFEASTQGSHAYIHPYWS